MAASLNSSKSDNKLSILEIGAFEGQATLWFCSELNAKVTVIDPLDMGSIENLAKDAIAAPASGLLAAFSSNLVDQLASGQVKVHQGFSQDELPKLLTAGQSYDVCYVDGSHNAADVLVDAVLASMLLKVGGLLVFDDYKWNLHKTLPELAGTFPPKLAIDSVLATWLTTGQYELLFKGYQVAIRKLK